LIERKMGMEITDYIESLKATPDALGPAVSFTDTSDSDVEAAARLGIVNGRGNGRFDPQGTITRQEAAAMLYRTAAEVGVPLPEPGGALAFDDSHQIAEYARDGVLFVATTSDLVSGKKVMEGVGGNLFSPLAGYTREQAYLTILRLYRAA